MEHFGDRNRDHGEIDTGTSERDEPDQVAGNACRDDTDDQRQHNVRKTRPGQEISRDETAGAVKGRLTERQQAGKAEQDVESDTEQAPNQDPVHGVGREP